jgi:DNA-binding transcriptional ArsR family regulator
MRHTDSPDAFDAIADPSRRTILELLGRGDATTAEIVSKTQLDRASVAKHLKLLRDVDLVRAGGERRNRQFTLNAPAMRAVKQWVTRFERLWGHSIDEG